MSRSEDRGRGRWKTLSVPLVLGALALGALVAAPQPSAHGARLRVQALGPSYPQIWGDKVVWQDTSGAGGGDVWLWDLTRGTTRKLGWAFGPGPHNAPFIYGDTVSWWDQTGRVRARQLGKAPVTVSSSGALAQETIRLWGNRYLWVDARDGGIGRLWTRVLGGPAETRVAPSADFYQTSPSLWGDWAVWEDGRFGTGDIYFKDLGSSAAELNLQGYRGYAGDQQRPAIWGNRIVWDDGRNSKEKSRDIYLYDRTTHKQGQATNLTPDPDTRLSSPMSGPGEGSPGQTYALVDSLAGFEVGDAVTVGLQGSNAERLKIASIVAPNRLNFATACGYPHNAADPVQVLGNQTRPSIFGDGGFFVVWQDNRKTLSPNYAGEPYGIRARIPDGSIHQLTPADNVNRTRPRISGHRVIWQEEVSATVRIGMFEFSPYCYDEGLGTQLTAKVRARASFAGHQNVTFQYGFGTSPGATDLSGGLSAQTAETSVLLVPSTVAPGPGEIQVPATSINLAPGTKYYVTAVVRENGSPAGQVNSDGVVVDVALPSAVWLRATPGDGKVQLTWSAASDGGSGIDFYEVLRWTDSFGAPQVIGEVSETGFLDDGTYGLAGAPANFTTYHYAVRAVDGAGNRSQSSTVDVRPSPAGAITLSSRHARVAYGARTILTAKLTNGSAAETPLVALYYRARGTKWAWRYAGSRSLSAASGTAAWTIRPMEHSYYQVRWAGDSGHTSASADATVRVAITMSIRMYPRIVRRRQAVVFSGRVNPRHRRSMVYLQRYYRGRWYTQARTRLSSRSTYRFVWRSRWRGKQIMRVVVSDRDRLHDSTYRKALLRVR